MSFQVFRINQKEKKLVLNSVDIRYPEMTLKELQN